MSTLPNDAQATDGAAKTPANARPRPSGAAPVVIRHDGESGDFKRNLRRLGPCVLMSVVFHIVLLGLFVLIAPRTQAEQTEAKAEESTIATETQEEVRKDPFLTTDVDPAATEFDTDINYNVDRKSEVSV